MRRCQIWQDWQAILRKDRDRLYCLALDLRNRDRSEWAKVVDPDIAPAIESLKGRVQALYSGLDGVDLA